MPLLLRCLFICFKNFVNDRQKRLQLGRLARLPLAIAGRFVMRKHFHQRMPVQLVLSASSSLAQLTGQHSPPDFGPLLHVSIHSSAFLKIGEESGLTAHLPYFTNLHICALHFSVANPTRQALQFSTAV